MGVRGFERGTRLVSEIRVSDAAAAARSEALLARLREEAGEFEHEPEWDSEDSNAYQDRVEAGLGPQYDNG